MVENERAPRVLSLGPREALPSIPLSKSTSTLIPTLSSTQTTCRSFEVEALDVRCGLKGRLESMMCTEEGGYTCEAASEDIVGGGDGPGGGASAVGEQGERSGKHSILSLLSRG